MTKSLLDHFQSSSYLSGSSAAYVESLYDDYLENPEVLDPTWRAFFDALPKLESTAQEVPKNVLLEQFQQLARQPKHSAAVAGTASGQEKVDSLIYAYRYYGHLMAKTNPLGADIKNDPRLDASTYGLLDDDKALYATNGLLPEDKATWQAIAARLRSIYTGSIGFECAYITDLEESSWLQQRIEAEDWQAKLPQEVQQRVLNGLLAADGLERYLDSRYVGQVRFSMAGCDGVIPLLDEMLRCAANHGVRSAVLGMAHRGRLNVLLHIMGKLPGDLFAEFEGRNISDDVTGDVKYHMGHSTDLRYDDHDLHLTMGYNPSHLEFINPVAMGSARARQGHHLEQAHIAAMPILLHGDSAFAGEGVVAESLQMSQTRAYSVSGSMHVVMNNQVGFTTSCPQDVRSSLYATNMAKIIEAPIFHVNADDFAGLLKVVAIAVDYRMRFSKDVVIDYVGFRRLGHNEADEPRMTQPMMYKKVDAHPGIAQRYTQSLIEQGVVTEQAVKDMQAAYRKKLEAADSSVAITPVVSLLGNAQKQLWQGFIDKPLHNNTDTSVPIAELRGLAARYLDAIPSGFSLQRQVASLIKARGAMAAGEQLCDWGFAETLAYASLLDKGHSVRISGQDSGRGTFGHRHAALADQKNGEVVKPLETFTSEQAHIEIWDSLLCETGSMGFEYGFSTTDPNTLTIWEAQFGDFANVAQVIVDQFISSGWQKWKRLSGLVLLLPHGYEGRGPEHSSARLERYLQMCAQNNMQVCYPSTAAQIFHLLRRQALADYRCPLVIMSPKSMLRNKLAASSIEDLASGHFQLVVPEIDTLDTKKITRVVLCSGKIYFELLQKRRELALEHIALLRIEQLYPFPYDALREALVPYTQATDVVWCQEEPKNQGAWFITRHRLIKSIGNNQQLSYAGRKPMAAPSPGYLKLDREQQAQVVASALGIE